MVIRFPSDTKRLGIETEVDKEDTSLAMMIKKINRGDD